MKPSTLILSGFAVWILLLTWASLCRWVGADSAFLPGVGLVGVAVVLYLTFTTITK